MIGSFLTSTEIAWIKSDLKNMVNSPEAHNVIFKYRTYSEQDISSIETDPIYGYVKSVPQEEEILLELKCVHKILDDADTDILSFRIAKVGDSVFYFYEKINLNMPDGSNIAIPESISIIDESGVSWVVNIKNSTDAGKYFNLFIGKTDYATVLIASIMRSEK